MKSELLRTLERNDGFKLKIQTKLQVGIVVLAVVVCFYVIILTSRILQLGSVATAHSHTLWARYFQKVQPPKKTCEMNNFIENWIITFTKLENIKKQSVGLDIFIFIFWPTVFADYII